MTTELRFRMVSASSAVAALLAGAALAGPPAPLAIQSARIIVRGTSNIHAYKASTTEARVTRAEFGMPAAGGDFWQHAFGPGGVEAFEVAIPAASLTSSDEGLDKNMHKALKVREHPAIVFRLTRFEPVEGAPNAARAIGTLRIAGVEREIALDMKTEPGRPALAVAAEVELLMTDFGIKPPKAMLGLLRTHPKVTVRIEAVIARSST